MSHPGDPTPQQVAALDGAIAELVDQDRIAGWVAIHTERFRNVFLTRQLGCWLLFTWADGSIEIEEDYPPYVLVPGLLSGKFPDDDRAAVYQVRWVSGRRRDDLWRRYGMHESPGHYLGLAARQRRGHD